LRVSGTGVLAHHYGTRVADGFFHSFSGWVIYIVAALMLFATGWGIDRLARFGKKYLPGSTVVRKASAQRTTENSPAIYRWETSENE